MLFYTAWVRGGQAMHVLDGINKGIWWSSWLRDLAIYVHAIGLNLELYLPSAKPHLHPLHLFQTVWVLLQSACPVHQMPALLVETVPQGRLIAENMHDQHFEIHILRKATGGLSIPHFVSQLQPRLLCCTSKGFPFLILKLRVKIWNGKPGFVATPPSPTSNLQL